MNIHEYQAKQILSDYGIPVPVGKLASTVEEAKQCAQMLERNAWVLKAQVHAGGRGQAGGVHVVDSFSKISEVSHQLLGTRLVTKQTGEKGLPVNSVLIEETVALKREFYLSVLVERVSEKLVFIVSESGGMDIEEVALTTPEKILSVEVNPIVGLQSYQCRRVAYALSLKGEQIRIMERIMRGMYQIFIEKDASQIEINPLVETENDNLLALDAKIIFDDNALSGHSDILALRDREQEDIKENKAQGFGLNYITLSGNIGCMVNGAGLAMATMDLVKLKGGEPANFLDVGGEATASRVTEAFKIILSDEYVKAILVNIFGGIVQCDMIAKGLIIAIEEVKMAIPIVVRLEGTNAELGRQLLNDSGLSVIAAENLEAAAIKVVELAEGV